VRDDAEGWDMMGDGEDKTPPPGQLRFLQNSGKALPTNNRWDMMGNGGDKSPHQLSCKQGVDPSPAGRLLLIGWRV
jgi:hypothetical protein